MLLLTPDQDRPRNRANSFVTTYFALTYEPENGDSLKQIVSK